jgi:hypothetical protein
MSRTELFFMLLVTCLMVVSAAREFTYGRYAMAATLAMIPLFGWLTIAFGT